MYICFKKLFFHSLFVQRQQRKFQPITSNYWLKNVVIIVKIKEVLTLIFEPEIR
jgi:hypothetical protein